MIFYLDNLHPQLRRAMMYLEDELWDKAGEACERVLDVEPENPYAYLIEMMAQLRLRSERELYSHVEPIRENGLFKKAVHFADEELAGALNRCADTIEERLEQTRREAEEAERRLCYNKALELMKTDATEEQLAEAKNLLERIAEHQNVEKELKTCRERLEKLRSENAVRRATEKKKQIRFWTIVAVGMTVMLTIMCMMLSSNNAKRAIQIEKNLSGLVFEGEVHDFQVNEGSFLVMEREVTKYTYEFTDADTVEATIVHCVDRDGTVLVIDGREIYDSQSSSEYTYEVGDVHISLFGKVTLRVGNKLFEMTVGSNDIPSKLVNGNLTLTR